MWESNIADKISSCGRCSHLSCGLLTGLKANFVGDNGPPSALPLYSGARHLFGCIRDFHGKVAQHERSDLKRHWLVRRIQDSTRSL